MNDIVIEHQPAQQRFVLNVNSATALLEYQLTGQSIDFYHTYVPPEFRGQGLAEQLVTHALTWAKSAGYQPSASCSYVKRFI
ncbi:GNAT family N-acetyltransferase [Alishewanella longhuensis]